jgi:ureidoglycolate hydrolase
MKRTSSALILILALLISLVIGVQIVKAQYTPSGQSFIAASPISISSPSNITYKSDLLTLNVTVTVMYGTNAKMVYNIDGENNVTIPLVTFSIAGAPEPISPLTIVGVVALPELPEGPHSLTVYATYQFGDIIGLDNKAVHFTINDGTTVIISNLSLENKTYNQNNLPLNFITDKPASWIGYSLDGKPNVTIAENTTLTGLSSGLHNITIYANDTFGNMGASETVSFTIAKPESEPFSTATVVAVSGASAVVVISAGLLVYFKKRKR